MILFSTSLHFTVFWMEFKARCSAFTLCSSDPVATLETISKTLYWTRLEFMPWQSMHSVYANVLSCKSARVPCCTYITVQYGMHECSNSVFFAEGIRNWSNDFHGLGSARLKLVKGIHRRNLLEFTSSMLGVVYTLYLTISWDMRSMETKSGRLLVSAGDFVLRGPKPFTYSDQIMCMIWYHMDMVDSLYIVGSEFHYTTHGFTLLSAVLEAASGEKFERRMRRLFRDLGMRSTDLDEHDKILPNRSR